MIRAGDDASRSGDGLSNDFPNRLRVPCGSIWCAKRLGQSFDRLAYCFANTDVNSLINLLRSRGSLVVCSLVPRSRINAA